MVETVTGSSGGDGVAAAARLLHDFNAEYDEPAPPPHELAARLTELIEGDRVTVFLAREHETGAAVGVAVMRVQPSVWSPAQEAYLAELYVVPSQRGQGYGRELITDAMRVARERGADYALVVTSEDDRLAQRAGISVTPPEITPESRLRLTGGRDEGTGFPIDGLPELIQYERLVLDVAKALWFRQHRDRKRVPKGFSNLVGLRLTKVEEGSAIPILVRPDVADTLPDVDAPSILDAAQDLIDEAFREIVTSNQLPDDFPSGLTNHFLRLGRTLQGNEAIEFGVPASGRVAKYTQPVRRRFLTASQNKDFPLDGTLVGQITALDTNTLTLTITDEAHQVFCRSHTGCGSRLRVA